MIINQLIKKSSQTYGHLLYYIFTLLLINIRLKFKLTKDVCVWVCARACLWLKFHQDPSQRCYYELIKGKRDTFNGNQETKWKEKHRTEWRRENWKECYNQAIGSSNKFYSDLLDRYPIVVQIIANSFKLCSNLSLSR